jgi:hypothetical protein
MKTRTRAQPRAVPRRTEIGGQPHSLAYINPDEEELLRAKGGGVTPDGGQMMHNGVPAFAGGDGDAGDGSQGESSPGSESGGGKGDASGPGASGPGGSPGGPEAAGAGGFGPDATAAVDTGPVDAAVADAVAGLGTIGGFSGYGVGGPGAEGLGNANGGDPPMMGLPRDMVAQPGMLTPQAQQPWGPMTQANPWTPQAYTWGMSPAADYEQIRSRWDSRKPGMGRPQAGLLG